MRVMEKQARLGNIIQADAGTFKDLVQKLTGAPGGSAHKLRTKATVSGKSPFKLQERRKHAVRDLEIIKLGVESTRNSPGETRSNSTVTGPLTPLGFDSVFYERVGTKSPPSAEERTVTERALICHGRRSRLFC